MTAIRYIWDNAEMVKASWWNFQQDGVAAFKLLVKSPLPPALSAQGIPGGPNEVLNVHQIKWINHHRAESDEYSSPEIIADTKIWFNSNGDLDNSNNSKDDAEADNEPDLEWDNRSDNSETLEPRNVSATLNVPRLIQLLRLSKMKAEMDLMNVNIMQTRRNKGIKKK